MMWGYGYPMMGYGFGWTHLAFSIFWTIVLAMVIVSLIRWIRSGKMSWHDRFDHGRDAAIEILKERYAKGEIDKAEFEEKKKDLSA